MRAAIRARGLRMAGALCVLALLFAAGAHAQTVKLQLENSEAYAGLPFVLAMVAEGFDEDPAPSPPDLAIEGCDITFLGTTPNTTQGVQIVNGRRSEWRRVQWLLRWRIEARTAGRYTVPAMTLVQGRKTASTSAATLQITSIETTSDMRIELSLPDRPVWVGETFEVTIDWLLRRDVSDHNFSVPLFNLDYVQVQPKGEIGRRKVAFPAGALDIELPYTQDRITERGQAYTRFRFEALVTVNRPGPIDVDPITIAAKLESGTGRDAFGFRSKRYQLFKAESGRNRLTVRPLPQQGRPASFENAIGTAFSLGVQASRTVVQVGDPVELQILVRGNGPLEGLSLPRLDGVDGLPPQLFSLPDVPGVGEIDPEGGGKTFDVTVRVRSAEVREIPPIAFSYFDPVAAEYRTIHSQPIALSVAGSAMVGAEQVTAAVPQNPSAEAASANPSGPRPGAGIGTATLIGADLSLSAPARTLSRALAASDVAPWIAVLYLLPVVVLVGRVWQVRTSGKRGRDGDLREALARVEQALDGKTAAREAAPAVIASMRSLARLTGNETSQHVDALERLETRAYDPREGDRPIPEDLADEVRKLARAWTDGARAATAGSGTAVVGSCLIALGLASALLPTSAADPAGDDAERLERARGVYQTALEEPDRVRRTRLFSQAEAALGEVAQAHATSPDLLTDWGNAALGAQDLGHAALAYRRALHLAPGHDRARKNLEWLRERSPEWLPRPSGTGALDSLVFWHSRFSVAQRHLIGALAFAAGLLLLAPWSARRTRLLRRLAVVAFIVWVATTGSALLDSDGAQDAVVINDGAILRSADNVGAPPVLSTPLPAGTELRILEERAGWSRIALADGTRGWVHTSAAEPIVPREG